MATIGFKGLKGKLLTNHVVFFMFTHNYSPWWWTSRRPSHYQQIT